MAHFRVAVCQSASAGFDAGKSVERLAAMAETAASNGARIAVFPEAFIGGYPKRLDYGVKVGLRTPEGREFYRQYWEGAIDVPGPHTARLAEIAHDAGIYLVTGVIERDGGTLYCTVLFFSPNGELLGKHRKLMPTGAERLIWGFGDGSTLPVFDTPFGKLGAVICWENYMPLMRMAMFAKGISIYCAPTVDDRETWLASMRHIALEGRTFVLSACQFARRSDYPDSYPIAPAMEPENILIRGGSCIIGPMGEILAGPVYDEEAVLTADCDPGDIARAKFDFDVSGHYSRPDVFQLKVNEATAAPVRYTRSNGERSGDD